MPSLIPSKGWGEVLREEVQSIALGIQSYSDTEFLMHLVLYNKLFHTCPCGCEWGEGEALSGTADLFLRIKWRQVSLGAGQGWRRGGSRYDPLVMLTGASSF